jgi:hypothetical protein
MDEPKPKYWFPAKRYGWGWGFPIRWQGWIVLAAYVLLVALAGMLLNPERRPLEFTLVVVGLAVLLVLVCWWKGEPARWRWGGD